MAFALFGAAALVLLLWGASVFARANPAQVAPLIRKSIGGACILFAGFLTLRGALPVAVPIFLVGLAMLGINRPLSGLGFPWGGSKSPGQRSHVRTSMLEMELDHDTGGMDGSVLAGAFAGRRLSDLDLENLLEVMRAARAANDRSEALLEAYLDRAHAGWRQADGSSGAGEAGERAARGKSTSAMQPEEARAILDVDADATADDIRAAHRRLMKLNHPDHGGSDYLAAKINQAKDVLLKQLGA